MRHTADTAIAWTEAGYVPDSVIRAGIRRLNRARLTAVRAHDAASAVEMLESFIARMNGADIAPQPDRANEQHYEVPAEFFARVLGRHAKYSCAWWDGGADDLDQAETDALAVTAARAGLDDGQRVLDLGCGWGSLSLWTAERYPASEVLAISNSSAQRRWIEALARERGLDNIRVETVDMNRFDTEARFDRIVSVEMFEHMRNYRELFRRVSGWLKPEGRFFMHIFCHRLCAYEFIDSGPSDWMSRHFFAGGMMPSADLPLRFQDHLRLAHRAVWNGTNYQKTANAWLQRLDASRDTVLALFRETYGADRAEQWLQRWRMFFMACAELFGHDDGQEWFVGHYLFRRGDTVAGEPGR
ncbi:SAM-dependent methyltransferase [Elongatibacter sediminis]|uniref:Cyclopropane-fatty-acyl-phospholipid synthase family protein n=1 Tax=Elongatibacter sediminis TaxID=3119006 RepID=A0AAW9R7V7_9GAMM